MWRRFLLWGGAIAVRRALVIRPRKLASCAGWTRGQAHRRDHAVIGEAQGHRVRQPQSRFQRKLRNVIVLQIQCLGFTPGNAFHILIRDSSDETIVVEEESFHACQNWGEFPREEIVAEIDDGALGVVG